MESFIELMQSAQNKVCPQGTSATRFLIDSKRIAHSLGGIESFLLLDVDSLEQIDAERSVGFTLQNNGIRADSKMILLPSSQSRVMAILHRVFRTDSTHLLGRVLRT